MGKRKKLGSSLWALLKEGTAQGRDRGTKGDCPAQKKREEK